MTNIIDLNRLWEGVYPLADPLKEVTGVRRIAAVLIAYGRYDFMRALRQLISQSFLREVIIVDMGLSSFYRETLEKFIQEHSLCHVINGREKAGLAEAYNLGSHYTSSDYLVFLTENVFLPKHALARLYAFAKNKSSPCVIGLGEDSPSSWRKKRDGFVGELMGFHAVHFLQENAFSHTTTVPYEALFMSARTFAMLKGMDPDCFGETVAWDFCLRAHYRGGDVYQANHIHLTRQNQALSKNWFKHAAEEWRRYRAWRYFYQKYVKKQTNIFGLLKTQLFFFLGFLVNIASLW